MEILFLLLSLLNPEKTLIYSYKNCELFVDWDTSYLYVSLKTDRIGKVLFATGVEDTGGKYFPMENLDKPFSRPLNHFAKLDPLKTFVVTTDEIKINVDTVDSIFLIKIKVLQEIYKDSKIIFLWLGLKNENDSLFLSFPKERKDYFPVFIIPVDQDGDGKWDQGVNIKAITRIEELQEKEENLKISRVKKFFNPEREKLEIEIKDVSDLNNISGFVFSLTGKKIKELEIITSGNNLIVSWDGRDREGKIQKPGVYLIVLKVKGEVWAQIPIVLFK